MSYTVNDELCVQSTWSPGVVKNEEVLLRTVFHPEHVLDGKVIETAISLTDLKSSGFSVDRFEYADRIILQKRIERLINNSPQLRHSGLIANFECFSVREFSDELDERAFIVIDTAEKENTAHASIYSAKERGKSALRKLRALLLPFLQERSSLEEIFS